MTVHRPHTTARHRSLRVLVVVVPLLLAAAIAATAVTPAAAATALAPAQPVVPLPPNPSCTPGSVEPACHLPATTQPSSPSGIPETPLAPGPPSAPVSCFPGALMPECGGVTLTPSTAPPCAGPDCIPQPTPLQPSAPGQPGTPGSDGEDQGDDCGITDPGACVTEGINTFFRGVVSDALNPLLQLLGETLLSTPEPSSLPSLGQLWTQSWQILLTVYVVLVLVAGIVLMSYHTLQSRYGVKEIAPRLAVGFLAGTLSLFVATKGIQLANALSQAVLGEGVDPQTAGTAMAHMVLSVLDGGGLWLVFLGFALAVMIVILLLTFIVRVVLTVLLIAAAPIVLMWHALPHTEGIAFAWWKAYGGVLVIQIGQSMTLVVTLRVFFAPGGFTVLGPTPSGLANLLLCLALLWVLIKIPFWFLAPLRTGRRSLIGSLVRGAIAYKTMGLLGGTGSMFRGGTPRGPRPRNEGVPADPPVTRSGQFLLPLRVRHTHPGTRRVPRLGELPHADTGLRAGPGQLSLFTAHGSGDDQTVSPNPRALPPDPLPGALLRDQLGLPITTRRDPDRTGRRPLAEDPTHRGPVPQPGLLTDDGRINRNARPPARLPRALIAPNTGMLPIHLRPAPPAPARRSVADDLAEPPPPRPQTGPGLITPSGQINRAARAPRRPPPDAYTGNRPLASGQYPLPLALHRHPKPTPAPEPAPERPTARPGMQVPLPLTLPHRRGPKATK